MPGDELHIRLFRDDDADAVAALWQAVFHDATPWRHPDAVFRRQRRPARSTLLVGTLAGRVVATVMVGYDGHRGWIYRLAVLPEHQRHGLGRALMQEAETRLRRLGCPKINLQVESDNADVAAFYDRLGFRREDRVSMGKPLAPAPDAPASRAVPIGVYLPQVGFTWGPPNVVAGPDYRPPATAPRPLRRRG